MNGWTQEGSIPSRLNGGKYMIIGKGSKNITLFTQMANRHGIVSGATGTGKTVSLQVITEQFSKAGVPVFLVDVKGDLAGIAKRGQLQDKVKERVQELEMTTFKTEACPVIFWDMFGDNGHPIRASISDMGSLLLGRLLSLSPTQVGTLTQIFKIAEDYDLPLIKLRDLQSVAQYVELFAKDFAEEYGKISTASIGAILRGLLVLETEEVNKLFGEPKLRILDLMRMKDGRGIVNILSAEKLITKPKVYTTFLLWLLSELYTKLPEVGDREKPQLVFFFDEAHLLFEDAPKVLLEKVEQVIRLIRSKGVGIFFVTQSPADIPTNVLGQLGNRVQHALRAYTPKDSKAVRIMAQTFRSNPKINVEQAITQLKVGEALVSLLDENGTPEIVERVLMHPPSSQIGPISNEERAQLMKCSPLHEVYEREINAKAAYHIIKNIREEQKRETQLKPKTRKGKQPENLMETVMNTFAKSNSSSLGSKIFKLLK